MSLIINHTLIPGRRECTFEDLKDEEIRKIFEYLGMKDRSFLSLMSKRFNNIFKTVRIWCVQGSVSMSVSVCSKGSGRLQGLVDRIPVIKSIKVSAVTEEDVNLLAAKHPELMSLDLSFGPRTGLVQGSWVMLKYLKITRHAQVFRETPLCEIKTEVLKSLWLEDCLPVDLDKFLVVQQNLVCLKLIGCRLGADGSQIKGICESLTKLETLDLSKNPDLTDEGVEILADSRLSTSLRSLCLTATGITGTAIGSLCKFRNLHTLAVASNKFADEGLAEYLKGQGDIMRNIRVMNISNIKMTDHGVEMLLEVFPGVEDLDLSKNLELTNKTIESITSKVACLTRLSVYGTEINNDGMRLLSKYAKLKVLEGPTSSLLEETTNRLRAACPKLVIRKIEYWGDWDGYDDDMVDMYDNWGSDDDYDQYDFDHGDYEYGGDYDAGYMDPEDYNGYDSDFEIPDDHLDAMFADYDPDNPPPDYYYGDEELEHQEAAEDMDVLVEQEIEAAADDLQLQLAIDDQDNSDDWHTDEEEDVPHEDVDVGEQQQHEVHGVVHNSVDQEDVVVEYVVEEVDVVEDFEVDVHDGYQGDDVDVDVYDYEDYQDYGGDYHDYGSDYSDY